MKSRASLWRFWSRETPGGGQDGQSGPEALGRRIHRAALFLIGGGFLFCLVVGGWRWALGYGIGGGVAVANLELLRQAVTRSLVPEAGKTLSRLVSGSLLRLLGIGIVFFLVIKFLPVRVIGLALGLLVGPVAVLVAGYAGTNDVEREA
ncbi:MAG: ATP synthase subunit I [Candidatus Methylomirabilales bacterium]